MSLIFCGLYAPIILYAIYIIFWVLTMATEDHVSYNIMTNLKNNGWEIFQYHPPGGQACWGITVSNKIIYPDIVAYKSGVVITIENKGAYNDTDLKKLNNLINNKTAQEQIYDLISANCKIRNIDIPRHVKYLWGHGFYSKKDIQCLRHINLLRVDENNILNIIPSEQAPFTL